MSSAPTRSTDSLTQQYISFGLSPQLRGMIPTQQLAETLNLELGSIIQTPDMPPAVIGICAWRGDILWLVDLPYLLGLSPLLTPDYQQAKCNVLRITSQQHTLGLLVPEVRQLVRCEPSQIQVGNYPFINPKLGHLIKGKLSQVPGEILLIIDLEAVIQSLNQRDT